MPTKVAVFGCRGQLGVEMVKELGGRGYEVHGFDRASVDVADAAQVERAIGEVDPAAVFNCAAYNKVDVAEKEPLAALQGNALAVRHLAMACRQVDAMLVHFSTDYVFDGTLGRPYTEDDATHPLGAYAVSKLAGEIYARAYLDHVLILRTCGVFGPHGRSTPQGNFVETMLRLAQRDAPIRVVEDYVASPTYAPALAARSADLWEKGLEGIYHAGGGTPTSWFDYARLIFEVAGLRPELRPTNEREYRTPARRPKYSALSNARMEAAGIAPMPSLGEAVEEYLRIRGSSA